MILQSIITGAVAVVLGLIIKSWFTDLATKKDIELMRQQEAIIREKEVTALNEKIDANSERLTWLEQEAS